MSDDQPTEKVRRPIVINTYSAGGTKLEQCFFLRIPDVKGDYYNFYNGDGDTIATGISDGVSFPFLLDGIVWRITDLKIYHPPKSEGSERIKAHGHWSNNVIKTAEAGTFAAESGGGESETYSASA